MTYSYAVALSSDIIELRVVYSQSVWAWSINSAEAQTLDKGVGTSKEAANYRVSARLKSALDGLV